MQIWRDMWPELSVLLTLTAMVASVMLTFFLTR
jgi:hypothetical protein